jgi:hypothetical protein
MSSRPPRVEVIDGHMTRTRVRREPGRTFVEVIVWAGKEATGDPVAEWELPVQLRYDLDLAARQAVAQTCFPAAEPHVDYAEAETRMTELEGEGQ